jgi:hypothetical protein
MNRGGVRWLGGLALALAGALLMELTSLPPYAATLPPNRPPPPTLTPKISVIPDSDHLGDRIATILARPLFNANRRPVLLSADATIATIPRLAGIVVSESERLAFFAGGPGAKAIVAAEGEHVGGYILRAIAPDRVTLVGPDGPQLLRPTFDPTPAASSEAKKTSAKVDQAALPIEGSRQSLLDLVRNGPQSDGLTQR